jgi:5,10-methylenetetrahydrofolate reductase
MLDLQAYVTTCRKAGAHSAITQYFFNSDAYFALSMTPTSWARMCL